MTEINLFKSSPDAYEVAVGETLFTEGDPGDAMYAVIEGHVEVTLGGQVVEQVGSGGILGELALIDASPRAATATATTPSRVARVDRKHFLFLVQEHPTFAIQVMAVMAERLRHANEARTPKVAT
ncbi:MAG: family transcriptional regulator, cyclic receptor protein [Actinomycetota bacterium]|nr:family transcriptional regulator, cyclic receptor protein [Actinomycetota bacterium]